MSKATDALMDELHGLTASELARIIREGIPGKDAEGNDITLPVPAAYISAAIKFLKDNDITADTRSGRFDPLQKAISDLPTFDDGEEDKYPFN